MNVRDFIITQYETINCNQKINSVIDSLLKHQYLVVVDDDGLFQGIITLKDFFSHPRGTAIACVSDKIIVDSNESIESIARLFVDTKTEALPIFSEGAFCGVVTIYSLIERFLIETYYVENEDINRAFLANDFDNIALFEYNGIGERRFFLSDNWFDITGIDPLCIHKKARLSWIQQLHPSCSEQIVAEIEQFVSGKIKKIEQIIRINHSQKGWIWIYLIIKAKESHKNGKPIHVLSFIRDISNMQAGFDEMVSQEELFNKVFSNSNSLVYYKKKNGDFQFVNDAFLHFFNISKEKIVNKGSHIEGVPEPILNIGRVDEEIIRNGKYQSFEEQLITEKGFSIFMNNKTPVFDTQNNVQGLFGILTDVTDLRKIEQELINSSKKITEINKKLQQELIRRQQIENENILLKEELKSEHGFEDIICADENFKKVLRQIEKVAVSDASVLITGETGTGKELVAKAIHQRSSRRAHVFVKINCAAIPENLIESELFGHEKGAFTGAIQSKIGKFEFADRGTIFLDEIAELPLTMQPKLLRVLQEGEFERIGSNKTKKVDVRIVAATNKNLSKEVARDKFREDLFYRLNVFPIHVPPLRERINDIYPLVNYFTKKYAEKNKKQIDAVSSSGLEKLTKYSWPGNIRELENLVERAVILSNGHKLNIAPLIPKTESKQNNERILTLDEVEREHILKVLEMTSWKVSGKNGAASLLGIKRTTLNYRMSKLGITYQKHLFEKEKEDPSVTDDEI